MFSLGLRQLQGWTNSSPPMPVGRLSRGWCQAVHSNAWWEEETQQTFIETREEQTVQCEKPFPHEGSQAVEQVPRGVVWCLSLETFKAWLITALSILV